MISDARSLWDLTQAHLTLNAERELHRARDLLVLQYIQVSADGPLYHHQFYHYIHLMSDYKLIEELD